MNERFNNSFRNDDFINTVPNQDTNINPYNIPYFGQGDNNAYIQGMNPPMPGGQEGLYPLMSSLAYPGLSPQADKNNYAKGGKVKKRKKNMDEDDMEMIVDATPAYPNLLPSLAEIIRQQGEGEDVILAHINPIEAQMLGVLANGGTTNPVTGLPQFGFFGGGIGSVLGTMLFPGVGTMIGGALGGAAENAIKGKKILKGALQGGLTGAIMPTAAGFLGEGASAALGAGKLGGMLSNYGANNSMLGSLGALGGEMGKAGGMSALGNLAAATKGGKGKGEDGVLPANASFLDSLKFKSKDYFSDPSNLLTAAVVGTSLFDRPKKKTPESIAQEQKRFELAMMLNPEERAKKEAAMLAEEQMKRRIARNKFLPEERLGNIEPIYVKTHTPEEYKKHGKWMSYYNNPSYSGNPILMKTGGAVPEYEEEITESPSGLSYYLQGHTGGQDDKIPAYLSDGEYVIDASTVANLGDGNNTAGAKKLDKFVKNVRKHKGGSIKLPPKAKSLTSYMGR